MCQDFCRIDIYLFFGRIRLDVGMECSQSSHHQIIAQFGHYHSKTGGLLDVEYGSVDGGQMLISVGCLRQCATIAADYKGNAL